MGRFSVHLEYIYEWHDGCTATYVHFLAHSWLKKKRALLPSIRILA